MAAAKKQFNYKIIWITRRKLVYTVGLVALSLGIIALAIYPQITESIALSAKHEKEQPKLEKIQSKLASLQNIDSLTEYEQADTVNAALPSNKPLLEFLTSLNSVAIASNIAISDFALSPGSIATDSADATSTKKTGPVDTLDLELEIKGTFDEVQQFLLDIEKISPFTTITQLSLGKGATAADRESNRVIDAKLSTSTYFFTQSIKATVDAPLPTLTAIDRTVLNALTLFQNYDLPEQTEIVGGGIQDPFGIGKLEILDQFGSVQGATSQEEPERSAPALFLGDEASVDTDQQQEQVDSGAPQINLP